MLLNAACEIETNSVNLPSVDFSLKESPIALEILSSLLYLSPINAVIRELLSNAYESSMITGFKKKTDLFLPDYTNKQFYVRDYGTGLSKEDLFGLYTRFFDSTKRESNEYTGCFGLGSKSPFAYSESFIVEDYYEGMKYTCIALKGGGNSSFKLLNEEETDEENGLKVKMDIKEGDIREFNRLAFHYILRNKEILENINRINGLSGTEFEFENYSRFESGQYSIIIGNKDSINPDFGVYIKQGQNTIKVELEKSYLDILMSHSEMFFNIVYEVEIGTLNINPSRESFREDQQYKEVIKNLEIDRVLQEFYNSKYIEQCDNKTKYILLFVIHFENDLGLFGSKRFFTTSSKWVDNCFNTYNYNNDLTTAINFSSLFSMFYPYSRSKICYDKLAFSYQEEKLPILPEGDYWIIYNLRKTRSTWRVRQIADLVKDIDPRRVIVITFKSEEFYEKVTGVRLLRRFTDRLNEIGMLGVNFHCLSIDRFCERYKNYKTKKTRSNDKQYTLQISFYGLEISLSRENIVIPSIIENVKVDDSNWYDIDELKSMLEGDRTIVVYREKESIQSFCSMLRLWDYETRRLVFLEYILEKSDTILKKDNNGQYTLDFVFVNKRTKEKLNDDRVIVFSDVINHLKKMELTLSEPFIFTGNSKSSNVFYNELELLSEVYYKVNEVLDTKREEIRRYLENSRLYKRLKAIYYVFNRNESPRYSKYYSFKQYITMISKDKSKEEIEKTWSSIYYNNSFYMNINNKVRRINQELLINNEIDRFYREIKDIVQDGRHKVSRVLNYLLNYIGKRNER